MSYKTADEVRDRIMNETDARDMLIEDIAEHGIRNVIHWIDYTDDEADNLTEMAKRKIRELQALPQEEKEE